MTISIPDHFIAYRYTLTINRDQHNKNHSIVEVMKVWAKISPKSYYTPAWQYWLGIINPKNSFGAAPTISMKFYIKCLFAFCSSYNGCSMELPLSSFVSHFFLYYHIGDDSWVVCNGLNSCHTYNTDHQ